MTGRSGRTPARHARADTHDTNVFPRDTPTIQQGPTMRRQWQVGRKRVGRGRGRPCGGERSASGRHVPLRIAGRSTSGATRWRSNRSITASTTGKSSSNTIYYSPQLRADLRHARRPDASRPRSRPSRIHPDDLPAYRRALIAHLKGDSPRFVCRIPLSRQSRTAGAGRARAASRNASGGRRLPHDRRDRRHHRRRSSASRSLRRRAPRSRRRARTCAPSSRT